jgi:hypothetical protein
MYRKLQINYLIYIFDVLNMYLLQMFCFRRNSILKNNFVIVLQLKIAVNLEPLEKKYLII